MPASEVPGNRPRPLVAEMGRLASETRADSMPHYLEVQTAPWPGNQTFFPTNATGRTDLARANQPSANDWSAREDPVLVEARGLLDDGVELDELLAVDAELTAKIAAAVGRGRDAEPAAAAAHDDVWGSR